MSDQPWYRNHASLWSEIDQHGSMAAAALAHGLNASTVQRAAKRLPRDASSAPSMGHTPTADVELAIDQTQVKWSDEDLLVFHDIDPEMHVITQRKAKRWNQAIGEQQVAEMNSLSITVAAKLTPDMILPARLDGPRFVLPVAAAPTGRPIISLLSCDWHYPYCDKGFESCFMQLLRDLQPDVEWDLGDLMDLPSPSRHRTTKGFEATPQECVNARYDADLARREIAPNTVMKRVLGNHDVRVDIAIQEKVGTHVSRLCPAHTEIPLNDVGVALRYDELGIELIRPDGDYHSVLVQLAEGLSGAHGTKSGPHGGAMKRMSRRNDSHVSAHDHKQVVSQHIAYDGEDPVITLSASIGCGASRALCNSYNEDADIHIGCAVLTDHGNGEFNIETVRYDDARQVMYFRDRVYRP